MNKKMKSFLCLMLLTILIFPSSLADVELTSFKPSITSQFDYTNSEWLSSKTHRAILCLLLSFEADSELKKQDLSIAMSSGAFVIEKSLYLNVFYRLLDNRILVLRYSHYFEKADFTVMDAQVTSDEMFKSVMKIVLGDEDEKYYTVSLSDIAEAARLLDSLFE